MNGRRYAIKSIDLTKIASDKRDMLEAEARPPPRLVCAEEDCALYCAMLCRVFLLVFNVGCCLGPTARLPDRLKS